MLDGFLNFGMTALRSMTPGLGPLGGVTDQHGVLDRRIKDTDSFVEIVIKIYSQIERGKGTYEVKDT